MKDIRNEFQSTEWQCGTRAKYSRGCRCQDCRRSNTEYEKERSKIRKEQGADVWVSTDPVREHLKKLSRKGIGYKTVAQYADVGRTCLMNVIKGKNKKMRRSRAERILAVDAKCVSGGTLISSQRSRLLIKSLMAEDFTKTELAKRLGYKSPAIQFAKRKKMTAKVAMRLERFWNLINLEEEL
ncbi:MAG: hypothetical protein ACO24B_01420 [Ilumatobacteraceae bacterium]